MGQLRRRLEVARHEAEKSFSQPDCGRFVRNGWLHPRKHGLLPASIYASRFQNWQMRAIDAEENVGRLQTEVDNLTAELNAQIDLTLTYAGSFSCTAYCAEEYAHICGEGHGITSSGAKVQPGVTVAADTSILPYGTVVYIEGVGLRVVQDTGSAVVGNKLDVAVNTHAEALSWSGWGSHRVWIVTAGGDADADT